MLLFNDLLGEQLSAESTGPIFTKGFQDRYTYGRALTSFSPSFKGRRYDNRFLAPIGENWHTPTFIL